MHKQPEWTAHEFSPARDVTISEFAQVVADVVGYTGKIVYDTSGPDGAPQKLVDVAKIHNLDRSLSAFALDWDAALTALEQMRQVGKAWAVDHFAALYAERIKDFRENPPPEDWRGIYEAQTK